MWEQEEEDLKTGNSFADLQIKSNKQAQHTHTEAHVHNCVFISQKLKPSNHDILTPFQGLFICLLFTAHWPSHPDLSLLRMAHLFQTDVFSMPAILPPDFSKWCLHSAAPTPSPPAQCLPPSHCLRLPSSHVTPLWCHGQHLTTCSLSIVPAASSLACSGELFPSPGKIFPSSLQNSDSSLYTQRAFPSLTPPCPPLHSQTLLLFCYIASS